MFPRAKDCTETYESNLFVRELSGDAESLPIVFFHGLGDSGLCFENIVRHERLNGLRRIIPDLPGYGRSLAAEKTLSLQETADKMAHWLIDRSEQKVILVGHSMGAIVAMFLATQYPDLVGGLVDVEGNKSAEDCTYSGKSAHQELSEFLETGSRDFVNNILSKAGHDKAHRSYFMSLSFADAVTFYDHSKELVDLSSTELLAEQFGSLSCPTVYIAGEQGAPNRSIELVRKQCLPIQVVPSSGHWPFIDQPDQFAAMLGQALSNMKLGNS